MELGTVKHGFGLSGADRGNQRCNAGRTRAAGNDRCGAGCDGGHAKSGGTGGCAPGAPSAAHALRRVEVLRSPDNAAGNMLKALVTLDAATANPTDAAIVAGVKLLWDAFSEVVIDE